MHQVVNQFVTIAVESSSSTTLFAEGKFVADLRLKDRIVEIFLASTTLISWPAFKFVTVKKPRVWEVVG